MKIQLSNYVYLEITGGSVVEIIYEKPGCRWIDLIEEIRQFLKEKGIFSSIIPTDNIFGEIKIRGYLKPLDMVKFAYWLQRKNKRRKNVRRKN